MFAAMTRWVPMADRRGRPRPAVAPEAAAYRVFAADTGSSRGRRLLKGGALGLTAVGLIGWLLRGNLKSKAPAAKDARPPDTAPPGMQND
jgi:hypothetical protein